MIIKSQDVNHITNFDYVKTINVEEVPTADGAVYYILALMKTDSKVEPKKITMACYEQEDRAAGRDSCSCWMTYRPGGQ